MSLTFGGALDPGKNIADELQKLRRSCSSGANWFYWIAGLSLVNSLILVFDGEWSFVVGLGVTQAIDSIAQALAEDSVIDNSLVIQIMAFALDVAVAAIFVLLGRLAAKRLGWPFVVGMILYAMDGLIFLLVQDWVSIGFHCFALFCIYGGYVALQKLPYLEGLERLKSAG